MSPEERAREDAAWRERRKLQDAAQQAQWEEEAKKRADAAAERAAWLQTTEGQTWLAAERLREAEYRVLAEAAAWKRDTALLGVPSRLAPAALEGEGVKVNEAIKYARDYVNVGLKWGESLVLLGDTGIGKSFAAAAILRAAAGRGDRKFWHFSALVGALLDPARRQVALEEAKETRLIVFDEIGGSYVKPGGLVEPLFEEIIFVRHGEFRPTVLTSNLSADEFKVHFSDRVIDRLREWGPVYAVDGPSMRQHYRPAESALATTSAA